ncbi:MAG: alpha/beta hydrolase [Alphaproteobacteria bacterium]|nr:alpha/beta hydrolase [Alphaproteobacteria bacterium]MCB9694132.1 alpha/beta hydrolase [Alphaproteobacteria bacterium]
MSTPDVVFVHGMFMTPLCWEGWRDRFEARGLRTMAPAWPGHDAPVEAQCAAHPDPARGELTLEAVVDTYRTLLAGMDRPAVVGHSMGGLVVQLLLQEGLARCGVAIHSAPPQGVISLKWSFLKSNWGSINPFQDTHQAWMLTFEQFRYGFVNGLPEDLQREAFATQVVPESRLVGSGPTTAAGHIDFAKPRGPLLLIAGEADHMIPASLNQTNFDRYAAAHATSGNQTTLDRQPGRTHYTLGQPGWEAVADQTLAFVAANA